ncbi:MAG: hypothetical protein BWY66_00686 [bacterium ADurb.Bin374]|nr:MAG: hypothetical protein BWY66_00686 [bacterium ADurb.Bin374]
MNHGHGVQAFREPVVAVDEPVFRLDQLARKLKGLHARRQAGSRSDIGDCTKEALRFHVGILGEKGQNVGESLYIAHLAQDRFEPGKGGTNGFQEAIIGAGNEPPQQMGIGSQLARNRGIRGKGFGNRVFRSRKGRGIPRENNVGQLFPKKLGMRLRIEQNVPKGLQIGNGAQDHPGMNLEQSRAQLIPVSIEQEAPQEGKIIGIGCLPVRCKHRFEFRDFISHESSYPLVICNYWYSTYMISKEWRNTSEKHHRKVIFRSSRVATHFSNKNPRPCQAGVLQFAGVRALRSGGGWRGFGRGRSRGGARATRRP